MEASLRTKLCDASPVFLFGTVPAMEGTENAKIRAQASKFADKMRDLAADGYIVYDIQEEKGRTPDPRPFPFRRMSDPVEYAAILKEYSGKDSVVYKCVAEHQGQPFDEWARETAKVRGVDCLNLVGGATSSVTYSGPTISEAAKIVEGENIVFGGVTIAERHMKKKNEHEIIASKVAAGAQWFISQAIYNPTPTIETINAYGALCKKEGKQAKKLILTFAPCGRPKTMTFMHWLGVSVPEETEKAILEAENPVATSVNLLCDMLTRIMKDTAGAGVPLGISIEHVSIFREEVAATFDLFRRSQAILLDNRGIPFTIQWTPFSKQQKKSALAMKDSAVISVPLVLASFVIGLMFGRTRRVAFA